MQSLFPSIQAFYLSCVVAWILFVCVHFACIFISFCSVIEELKSKSFDRSKSERKAKNRKGENVALGYGKTMSSLIVILGNETAGSRQSVLGVCVQLSIVRIKSQLFCQTINLCWCIIHVLCEFVDYAQPDMLLKYVYNPCSRIYKSFDLDIVCMHLSITIYKVQLCGMSKKCIQNLEKFSTIHTNRDFIESFEFYYKLNQKHLIFQFLHNTFIICCCIDFVSCANSFIFILP